MDPDSDFWLFPDSMNMDPKHFPSSIASGWTLKYIYKIYCINIHIKINVEDPELLSGSGIIVPDLDIAT